MQDLETRIRRNAVRQNSDVLHALADEAREIRDVGPTIERYRRA